MLLHAWPAGLLLSVPLLFHALRLALGYSLEDCMDGGWVVRPTVRLQRGV